MLNPRRHYIEKISDCHCQNVLCLNTYNTKFIFGAKEERMYADAEKLPAPSENPNHKPWCSDGFRTATSRQEQM